MEKIDLHLENCYGIKNMQHCFDFTKSKTHLVYAPNGAMKSSFAKTFEDIAENISSKDRIFTNRVTHRDIKVDNREIKPEEIFVIQRMKDADFKEASTILANAKLKKEYDTLNKNLNKTKKEFLKLLNPNFGLREKQLEIEIENTYKSTFFKVLENVEQEVNSSSLPIYTSIKYNEVFNDKVLKFLGNKDFKTKIKEYINIYDKLVNKSTTLFKKDAFNHYNADSVTKSLNDNNFFKANHKVKIKDQEINDTAELEELIKAEKEKVLKDPELTSKFEEIDKSLNSNNDLRKFRSYVEQNQDIIKEFVDLGNFRKKLIVNYLKVYKSDFDVLLRQYRDTNAQRTLIVGEAKKEQKDWENVLKIFRRRFTVPFKMKIKNQEDVILKDEPASLIFEYTDGTDKTELGGAELHESLSTGEQRVFYLLNIIFQIEARRKQAENQVIIVDDIADSFDYKNKYAIIEYLKDVLEEEKFNMIVLTHNFDFYKTIKSRLGAKINYEGNWRTIKKADKITLVVGEKKDVFPTLRKNYDSCDFTFISCIPFVRNLIEFSVGMDNDEYALLTSLLHHKPENTERNIKKTNEILVSEVFNVFNACFNFTKTPQNPNVKVLDLINQKASEIVANTVDDSMDIKSKICLSLCIRLQAEDFMIQKITDANFHTYILKKQTGQIVGQYKKEYPTETESIGVLDRVNLMTPENIHVNSFMYEPLMDLSEDHLKQLYQDVINLN